jgi:hypothetical protein
MTLPTDRLVGFNWDGTLRRDATCPAGPAPIPPAPELALRGAAGRRVGPSRLEIVAGLEVQPEAFRGPEVAR